MATELLEKKIIHKVDMTNMKTLKAKEGEAQANSYLLRCIKKLKPEGMNAFMMDVLFKQDERLFYVIMDAVEKTEFGDIP